MATLSPKPDPWSYPYLSSRLGPGAVDLAKERCTMSIVLLQGGGLSRRQIAGVPLGRLQDLTCLLAAVVLRRRRATVEEPSSGRSLQ